MALFLFVLTSRTPSWGYKLLPSVILAKTPSKHPLHSGRTWGVPSCSWAFLSLIFPFRRLWGISIPWLNASPSSGEGGIALLFWHPEAERRVDCIEARSCRGGGQELVQSPQQHKNSISYFSAGSVTAQHVIWVLSFHICITKGTSSWPLRSL